MMKCHQKVDIKVQMSSYSRQPIFTSLTTFDGIKQTLIEGLFSKTKNRTAKAQRDTFLMVFVNVKTGSLLVISSLPNYHSQRGYNTFQTFKAVCDHL